MKKILVFIMIVLLFLSMTACSSLEKETVNSVMQYLKDIKTEDSLIAYNLSREQYYEFVRHPSMEYLYQNTCSVDVFKISPSDDTMLEYKAITTTGVSADQAIEGVFRLGSKMPIHSSLINFISNNGELKNYLYENGIHAEIENVATVCTAGLTALVFIDTNDTDVFVSIDTLSYNEENSNQASYGYCVYSPKSFAEYICPREGILVVNGSTIVTANPMMIHSDYVEVPLLSVLKALGAKIEWNTDVTATVFLNHSSFALDIAQYSFVEEGKTENLLYPPISGITFVNKIDSDLVMDNKTMRWILKEFDAEISVDRDSLSVIIQS